MKKLLVMVMVLAMFIPTFAMATAEVNPLELNYSADSTEYEGNWVLTSAYEVENGFLEVPENAATLEVKVKVEYNELVDMEAYIHADVNNLQGTLSFSHDEIDVDDYRCSANYDDFTVADFDAEGVYKSTGAVKFKVRDDDEGVFFDVLTGVEIEDMEIFEVLALNTSGQLVLGYSDDKIERGADEGEFAYAYIFDKVVE